MGLQVGNNQRKISTWGSKSESISGRFQHGAPSRKQSAEDFNMRLQVGNNQRKISTWGSKSETISGRFQHEAPSRKQSAEDFNRKSTRLNSSHIPLSRMPSSA